jgi:resuscitation-promoting factor RpfA
LPPEAPERPAPTQPPAAPVEPQGAPTDLRGRKLHTVRPGESLWSIAAALLPAGASNEQIAAEVQRLWQLNKIRIGTGDPSLILVGTVLRLR